MIRRIFKIPSILYLIFYHFRPIDSVSAVGIANRPTQKGAVDRDFPAANQLLTIPDDSFIPHEIYSYNPYVAVPLEDLPTATESQQRKRMLVLLAFFSLIGGTHFYLESDSFIRQHLLKEENVWSFLAHPAVPMHKKLPLLESLSLNSNNSPVSKVLAEIYYQGDYVDQDLDRSQKFLQHYLKMNPSAPLPDFEDRLEVAPEVRAYDPEL